jgi:hypothetical protein
MRSGFVPLSPIRVTRTPLHIHVEELWCRRCGAEGTILDPFGAHDREKHCVYCGSTDLVPAVEVLRPGEYTL